eukprot:TRINITY_DN19454_c0_g1_i1.p1 TRINITY_DN19454_c0_g1~~TRINITY_DN19454_c0_g1_i1.p1  ORF type:complete len:248 (-),score=21.82 TRINITY_DN19454_c0_g1_i1:203-871(-)
MSPFSLVALAACAASVRVHCLSFDSSSDDQAFKAHVKLIEWQGCPDCSVYGKRLITQGLKHGLGSMMNMSVYLRSGHTSHSEGGDAIHSWVACGNAMVGSSDPDYLWYRVAVCAMPGGDILDKCLTKYTSKHGTDASTKLRPVHECVNDAVRSQRLVNEMHAVADKYHSFPSVLVDDEELPPPDQEDNRLTTLIAKLCDKTRVHMLEVAGNTKPSLPTLCQN